MIITLIILAVLVLVLAFATINLTLKLQSKKEELITLENSLNVTRKFYAKAEEVVVNLTEAERERVTNRILKKKDQGKKVR